MGPLLQVTGLTKRFGGLTAVSKLDFDLRKGEILGVIGPTRLNYARVVPMVDFTARSLGRIIG